MEKRGMNCGGCSGEEWCWKVAIITRRKSEGEGAGTWQKKNAGKKCSKQHQLSKHTGK